MHSPRFRMLLLAAVGLSLMWTTDAAAQSQEYRLKAVYLYNFGQHVTWPDNEDANFVIGILGKYPRPPFGGLMQQMEAVKTVRGKKIVVRHYESMQQYQPCHLLFISRFAVESRPDETVGERLSAAVEKTKGSSVLLVTESKGLASKGAMINFVVDVREKNRITMDINQGRAKQEDLKIGARLLNLEKRGLVRLVN
jgi:hypothetical protein